MNQRRFKQIESIASNILDKLPNKQPLSIDVEYVANFIGLNVVAHEFNTDISGVLVIDGDEKTIGYNKNNPPVRNRFTIAHEIGHFVLGHQRGGLFVDNKNFSVLFRNDQSATGEILQEREANAFAASLLMPEKRLREEIQSIPFDLCDDDDGIVNNLSIKFGVSTQAMTFRLSNLGIFK